MMPGAIRKDGQQRGRKGCTGAGEISTKKRKPLTYLLHLCVCCTIVMDRKYEKSGRSDIERGKHAPSVVMMNSYSTKCQEA